MISFTQFHYFLIVAEERSFTKAAKRLFISQQSLSTHIQSIESELHTQLFERTSPLKLTYAGEIFKDYALKFSLYKKELYTEMDDLNHQQKGVYRFGISHTRGAILLPYILPILKKEFPKIEFYILEANFSELQKKLVNGSIDMIIEQLPFTDEHIDSIEICQDCIAMIISDGLLKTRFGSKSREIKNQLFETGTISLLTDVPFLVNNKGNSVRAKIENILKSEGMEPESRIETENLQTLLNLCANNYGITFYPMLFFKGEFKTPLPQNVNVIPLSYPETTYSLGVGYRKKHYLSKISLRIIELLKEYHASLND